MDSFKNPTPTVDAVIFWRDWDAIIIIERKNPPLGGALPGGFVNEGESLEEAIRREVREELGIDIFLHCQFHTYSDPKRDPRKHVMTTVFIASTTEFPTAGDDAAEFYIWDINQFAELGPGAMAFDHQKIIKDVRHYLRTGRRPGEAP